MIPPIERRPETCQTASQLCRKVIEARGSSWLTNEERSCLFSGFEIFLIPAVPVRTAAEAISTAGVMGFPVVARQWGGHPGPRLSGHSEIDLQCGEDVSAAFRRLAGRSGSRNQADARIAVQPMIHGSSIAIKVLAEKTGSCQVLLDDGRTVRVASLNPVDRPDQHLPDSLVRLLSKVSTLVEQVQELLEVRLEPVVLSTDGGCHVIDASVRVGTRAGA